MDSAGGAARSDDARDAFIWVASHALNGLTQTIYSSVRMLQIEQAGESLSARQRAQVDNAYEDTLRLIQVIADLQLLAQSAAGTLEPALESLPVTTLVRQSIDQAQRPGAPDPQRVVSPQLARSLALVRCDPKLARRALAALIENALRFTPMDAAVRVEARKRGGKAQILVSDTGPGLPAGEVERCFEPLARGAKAERQVGIGAGMGLGLAVALASANAQHGRLWYEPSSTGTGAVFILELPLASE